MVIGRDCGFTTPCHSCRFTCQQRVLKAFPGRCYLCTEGGIFWLWHFLVTYIRYSGEKTKTTFLKITSMYCLLQLNWSKWKIIFEKVHIMNELTIFGSWIYKFSYFGIESPKGEIQSRERMVAKILKEIKMLENH